MKEWREWLKEINAGENYPMSTFAQAMLLLDNRLEALEQAASAASSPITASPTKASLSAAPDDPTGAPTPPLRHPLGDLTEADRIHVVNCFVCMGLLGVRTWWFETPVLGAHGGSWTSVRLGSAPSVGDSEPATSPSSELSRPSTRDDPGDWEKAIYAVLNEELGWSMFASQNLTDQIVSLVRMQEQSAAEQTGGEG